MGISHNSLFVAFEHHFLNLYRNPIVSIWPHELRLDDDLNDNLMQDNLLNIGSANREIFISAWHSEVDWWWRNWCLSRLHYVYMNRWGLFANAGKHDLLVGEYLFESGILCFEIFHPVHDRCVHATVFRPPFVIVAELMPYSRHGCGTGTPDYTCINTVIIWQPVNHDFYMQYLHKYLN